MPRGSCGYRAPTTGRFSRTSRASGRPQHAERGPPAALSLAPAPHAESAAILLKLLGAAASISPSVIRMSGAERTTCRELTGNEGHVDGLDLRMGANRTAPRHGVAPRLRQAPPAAPQASPSACCLAPRRSARCELPVREEGCPTPPCSLLAIENGSVSLTLRSPARKSWQLPSRRRGSFRLAR